MLRDNFTFFSPNDVCTKQAVSSHTPNDCDTMGLGCSTNSARAGNGSTDPHDESDERREMDFMLLQTDQRNVELEQFENESQHARGAELISQPGDNRSGTLMAVYIPMSMNVANRWVDVTRVFKSCLGCTRRNPNQARPGSHTGHVRILSPKTVAQGRAGHRVRNPACSRVLRTESHPQNMDSSDEIARTRWRSLDHHEYPRHVLSGWIPVHKQRVGGKERHSRANSTTGLPM